MPLLIMLLVATGGVVWWAMTQPPAPQPPPGPVQGAQTGQRVHTGQAALVEVPHPACTFWQPLGQGLEQAPEQLRAQILMMASVLAAHPSCPGPGQTFASDVGGGVVVQWYCRAPGKLVPVSYCKTQTSTGWAPNVFN